MPGDWYIEEWVKKRGKRMEEVEQRKCGEYSNHCLFKSFNPLNTVLNPNKKLCLVDAVPYDWRLVHRRVSKKREKGEGEGGGKRALVPSMLP